MYLFTLPVFRKESTSCLSGPQCTDPEGSGIYRTKNREHILAPRDFLFPRGRSQTLIFRPSFYTVPYKTHNPVKVGCVLDLRNIWINLTLEDLFILAETLTEI